MNLVKIKGFLLYDYSVPLEIFWPEGFLLTFPQPWEQDSYLPIFLQ